jgi:hypothetical protein
MSRRPAMVAACAALLTAATVLPCSVRAADTAPAKPAVTPKSKANVMTREELRACLDERDQIQAQRVQIQKENDLLGNMQSDLKRVDAQNEQRKAALDPADAAGAQALQADIVRRDEQADAFNARLSTLRAQAAALETRRASYVQRCETRPYDEMDEAAIMRDRRKAAQAAGAAKK